METALENSVWVTSPEFAGWLVKRGFRWRKLWTKRWVALHGTEIAYMAEEPGEKAPKDMLVTKCQIIPATVINRDDVEGHPHGFAVHINDGVTPVWYLRAESTREKKSWLMRLGHVQEIVKWLDNFEKVRVLGVGATGIVYELQHKVTGKQWALKEMEIKNKAQMQMALQEAEMLKEIMENISHPNIMHIDKVFQVGLKFYLVFPLCTGGELYEHVIRRGHFSEHDAAVIMHDLMSGLLALHQRDILHLDIKPENILFETAAEDARIKITDFGLSKVLAPQQAEDSLRSVSVEDMAKKLKSFQESGVLQRDRLRGTVGYMSPELILMGVSSAATDVWAAGVVLYILLCGHPPFQSKSNREILERSAKGQYSLDGKEWEGVSDLAKDLVRRMLTVDPEKRITVAGCMAHPWIVAVATTVPPAPPAKSTDARPSAEVPPLSPLPSRHPAPSGPRGPPRTAHLGNALHALSGHVKDRRLEKMAVSFTRLVSTLQSDGREKDRRRMIDTLLDKDGEGGGGGGDSDASMFVLSQEYKDALKQAFRTVGMDGGKLTVEQFVSFMNQFAFDAWGSSGETGGGLFTGMAAMVFCRFVDRDGDGFISPEDVFTSQALVIQRAEVFLRVVFRLYVEAVWYPGKGVNMINMQLSRSSAPKTPGAGGTSVLEDPSKSAAGAIWEPPKYITAKHVATVFEKVGFDPEGGVQIFNALCEALRRRDMGADGLAQRISSEDLSAAPIPPVPEADATPPASAASKHAQGARPPVSSPLVSPTSPAPARNAALTAMLMDDDEESGASPSVASAIEEAIYGSKTPSLSSAPSSQQERGSSQQADPSTEEVDYRMDINDFIRVQQIDDVLVTALLRRPQRKMAKLLKTVSTGSDGQQVSQRLQEEMQMALSRGSLSGVAASPEPARPFVPPATLDLAAIGRAMVGLGPKS